MCGRFFVAREDENELLARMVSEAARRQQTLTGESAVAIGEVFPSDTVAALAAGKSGAIGAFPMAWGFHRADGKGLIINTRSETALTRPLFRASMLERRCVIPCNWYFEWETREGQQSLLPEGPSLGVLPEGGKKLKHPQKIKYALRPKAPGLCYLAGIYRYEEGRVLPSLSILTRDAAESIAFIHSRMPVLFSEKTYPAWLDRTQSPEALLAQCEQEMDYRSA